MKLQLNAFITRPFDWMRRYYESGSRERWHQVHIAEGKVVPCECCCGKNTGVPILIHMESEVDAFEVICLYGGV